MSGLQRITFAMCLIFAAPAPADAGGKDSETRGQLLYSTHCKACHAVEIHWREQKLATDWDTLVFQVRRWQYINRLGWSVEEITDVAAYLNVEFYGYRNTAHGSNYYESMRYDYMPVKT